jgi:hypothetical protein
MCKMRADEENTIMPESEEERRGCGIAYVLCVAVSVVVEAVFCEELVWFCGDGCGTHVLSGKWSWDCARVAPKRQV